MPRYAPNRRTDVAASGIVHVRLTPREKERLRAAAEARGLKPADVIRDWIEHPAFESLVDQLEALAERGDPEEIEAAAEIVSEARAKVPRRFPEVEVVMRRAG